MSTISELGRFGQATGQEKFQLSVSFIEFPKVCHAKVPFQLPYNPSFTNSNHPEKIAQDPK